MIDLQASLQAQLYEQNAEGCCKIAEDLDRYRIIIERMEPDGILECGSYSGKSAGWFARTAHCPVLSIDVTDVHALDPDAHDAAVAAGVTFFQGMTTSREAVDAVAAWSDGKERIMVSLDSDHSAATVLAEMELYAQAVNPGGYMVVEDGIIRWIPAQLWPQGPYRGGPMDAIEAWLPQHPEWEQDTELEDLFPITQYPGGFLRRVR